MSSKRFAATGLLAVVFIAVACFFGGCEGGGEGTSASLAGDWQTIYDDDDGMGIVITTLTASGNVIDGGFLKVGDYWIESWENVGTWRTSKDTLYQEFGAGDIDTVLYTISGNRVTLRFCTMGVCNTTIAEKVDAADVKSRLGTVHGQDPALFTSTAYYDLMWYSESDENEILDFDMMYFWNGERYFGDEEYYDQVWYTTGSRLFLIGMDNGGKVEKTVELEYNVINSGSAAKLSIRPILDDGGLGPEDIWLPDECWDCGWDWELYKSKRGGKKAKKHKGPFASRKANAASIRPAPPKPYSP